MSNEQIDTTMENEDVLNRKNPFLLALVIFLVLTNIISITYIILKEKEDVEEVDVSIDINKQPFDSNIVSDDKPVETASSTNTNINDQEPEEKKEILNESELDIAWNEQSLKINHQLLFNDKKVSDLFDKKDVKNIVYMGDGFQDYRDLFDIMDILEVGKVLNGEYKDKHLYVLRIERTGPGRKIFARLIKNNDDLIVLAQHSDDIFDWYNDLFIFNDKLTILNLEPQNKIDVKIEGEEVSLVKSNTDPHLLLEEIDSASMLFELSAKKFYKNNTSGCIVTTANDGTLRDYFYDLDFIDKKEGYSGRIPRHLDITWLDGQKNLDDYIVVSEFGCGGTGCYNYPDYINDQSQLLVVGETSTGENIYELKDKSMKKTEADTKTILKEIYDISHYGDKTETFDEFVNNHPLIYWQDPYGEFAEFRNAKYQPMAECGKPVIYLYPEEELDARVYVEPNSGFTITEPAYNDGWYVHAKPNGELYNYADKTTYPYLFWEGHASGYSRPSKGFVVAREDVNNFLIEKLKALGLIESEYDEFVEFWLPKMQEKPYYFVTFMDQADFEKIAPLTVLPKPDTVIRVFMDYEGLDEYIQVDEPTIETPERLGFTVVEWGGALHR